MKNAEQSDPNASRTEDNACCKIIDVERGDQAGAICLLVA